MVTDGSSLRHDVEERVDVVVIGSGAGGAVVAKELAEAGVKVLIVEEGAYWKSKDHSDLPYEALNRMYRDRGFTTTLGKPVIPLPMGKALGGTTVINSGTCFRTPSKIFQHWTEDLGLTTLNEAEFAPLFERVEREINVVEADFAVMSRANVIFHELLAKKGIHGKPLKRNIRGCEGCGFCCYGCPSGAKQSMDNSYLPRAFVAGAKAITNCRVDKLLTKGRRVIGLKGTFRTPGGRSTGYGLKIFADKVIVAAGTIHSPLILRENGIGIDNKNLGRNLTIHPATKVFAVFDEEVYGWEGTPQAYYLDVLKDEGIVFEGIFLPPDIGAMGIPFVGRRMNEFMHSYKNMAAFGIMISDSSTGRVTKMPFLGTTILYNLNMEDMAKIKKGIGYVARIFLEGGAKKVYTLLHKHIELYNVADVERMEKAHVPPEDFDGMAFHPLGTCRMGASEELGVVDDHYRVFGWEGVYVCDGSVIPTSLGVNPQETIMAFATRLALQLTK